MLLLWRSLPRRPLTDLHDDVLRCIVDCLGSHDLAMLANACSALHPLATRALYAHITLSSYTALDLLVRSLERHPALGQYALCFAEDVDHPFLFLETHSDSPPPHLLARALRHMSCLRALKLRSPIEIPLGSELQSLRCLRMLELRDATPETMRAVLPHIAPVDTLVLRCASAGWSDDRKCRGGAAASADVGALALQSYLLRCAPTLRALEVDAALLHAALSHGDPGERPVWHRVRSLKTHGRLPLSGHPLATLFPALDAASQTCTLSACCGAGSSVSRRTLNCNRNAKQGGFFGTWWTAQLTWAIVGSLCSIAIAALL